MKHCSSCKYCVMDIWAINMGVVIDHCMMKGHLILHPFFNGFRCRYYRREQT